MKTFYYFFKKKVCNLCSIFYNTLCFSVIYAVVNDIIILSIELGLPLSISEPYIKYK